MKNDSSIVAQVCANSSSSASSSSWRVQEESHLSAKHFFLPSCCFWSSILPQTALLVTRWNKLFDSWSHIWATLFVEQLGLLLVLISVALLKEKAHVYRSAQFVRSYRVHAIRHSQPCRSWWRIMCRFFQSLGEKSIELFGLEGRGRLG